MVKSIYQVPEERIWFKNYPENIPHHLDYPDVPLYWFLDQAAEKHPDKTALVFMGKKMTYQKLKNLADRFASSLQKLGVKKGDKVAFLLPNCPQFVIGFWGALKAGACLSPANPLYSERELEEMLVDSEAKFIVVLDALWPKLKKVQEKTGIEKVIVTGIEDFFPLPLKIIIGLKNSFQKLKGKGPKGKEVFGFKDLLKQSTPDYQKVSFQIEKDLAVLQYTGGTTGKPKGVMLTHLNLIVNTWQLKYWFSQQEGKETIVGVIPFFHVGGMTSSITWGTSWASKLVIIPRFHTKPTLKAITKYKATSFVAVPAIYIALDRTMKENPGKYSFESLELVGAGMAPCPRDLFETYKKAYGKKLIEGYGLSENAGVTFQNLNTPEAEYRAGSIGFPFPDTDAKIINSETGEILGPNQPGELCLKGPHITVGYWKNPEENAKAIKDGWLLTGDMARMDQDGYFYILGRKDDVIGVKGFQVYPREIENVLEDTNLVGEAAVIGIPDYYAGQKIIAYVTLEKGKQVLPQDLLKVCRENLAPYKVPSEIRIREDMPRSPARKILKYVLREEAIKETKKT